MRGSNLLLNAGTIFSIGMMVAYTLFFQPEAAPWVWPAIGAASAVLIVLLVLRNLSERRKHHQWLEDRVTRARITLRDEPGNLERHEDLYEALTDLRRDGERLTALEAWAAADPENKSVQRRLRELREKLGQPAA